VNSLTSDEIDLDAPISIAGVLPERALKLYGGMKLIRGFEGRVNTKNLRGRIPGTIHLSTGQ
jgi:TPP-dependent pyruvate/acetoin dehydrogenase alpha subunit